MLNADLGLSNDFDKWNRAKNAKKRKGTARKSQAKTKKKDEEEPGFHFIAYVPINDLVWRLDGMQRQPVNLGIPLFLVSHEDLAYVQKAKLVRTG